MVEPAQETALPAGAPITCPCEAVAYHTTRDFHDGDPITGECVTHPDGSPVHDGDPIRCPACGSSGRPGIDGVLR